MALMSLRYPEYMYAKIRIDVETPLDTEHQEELEEAIEMTLRKFGVKAKIKSLSTGNEMTV